MNSLRIWGGGLYENEDFYDLCDGKGLMHLALSSDKAVFYVFAESKGIQAVFFDNSFTLLPDHPRDLTFRLDKDIPIEALEKALTIRHLRAFYSE